MQYSKKKHTGDGNISMFNPSSKSTEGVCHGGNALKVLDTVNMANINPDQKIFIYRRLGLAVDYFYHYWDPITNSPKSLSSMWEFNGDICNPTFKKDVIIVTYQDHNKYINHFKIENGRFYFFEDSTHNLTGKSCKLKPFSLWDDYWKEYYLSGRVYS